MIKKYKVGLEIVEAKGPADLIRRMHLVSFNQQPNDRKFMEAIARQTKLQNGKDVRTDTPANFIGDLIGMGLIQRMD